MNVMDLFNLKGKVAIVTGGGRGIGQFIAEGLAEAGADIVIASRNIDKCRVTAGKLEELGIRAVAVRCDLGKTEEIERLVDSALEKFGKINILVNNAGTGWIARTLDFPIEKWDMVLNINLRGTWILTQKVARIMKERGGGKIIFISSVWGEKGIAESIQPIVAYSASKGAINSLVKDLAVKLVSYNIFVNGISPGLFHTDMAMQFEREEKKAVKRILIDSIPLGRMGECDDIKGLAVFLASSASNYMTGQIITLDGGATCTYMPARI